MNIREKQMYVLSTLDEMCNGEMPDRIKLRFNKVEFEDFMSYLVKNEYIDNFKFTNQERISICKDVKVTPKGISYLTENRQLLIEWRTPRPVHTKSTMDVMREDGYSIEERIYMHRMFAEE